ncbi:MAG: M48 family metalloprotease [Desulfobacterales bacterium]
MQSIYSKSYFRICLIILAATWSATAFGGAGEDAFFDQKSKDQITTGVLDKDLTIMPQLNKINFGFGRYGGIEYFYEKTISKIFFQDKKLNARIIDVSIEDADITLELSHPILGTGSVKFSFSLNLLRQTTDTDIQKILLETMGDENHQWVVLDPVSKLYHLWSCNHFSDPNHERRMKREDAERQGYRPSRFCFQKMLYLPELALEKAIAREWATRLCDYDFVGKDSEKQMHLTAVGKKIVKNWPLKLRGYDYAFILAKGAAINAFAIPAGKIIITTALFDSLDNDDEMEALLVYAIAHIEQRHSLKKYYSCLENEKYTDAMKKLATVAGVLTGPAGGGISGALNLALPDESCAPQSITGYQQDYIQQADSIVALYFDIQEKERRAILSLIKKLQLSELAEKLRPDVRLHHPVNVADNARIKRLQNIKFKYFNNGNHFVLKRIGETPVQLNLWYQKIFEKENQVHIYLDEKALLKLDQIKNGKADTWLSIIDKAGTHRFEHQKDLLIEDIWGACLTFNASNSKKTKFLQDIEKIVLNIGRARRPSDKLSDQAAKVYTFAPGTIEW